MAKDFWDGCCRWWFAVLLTASSEYACPDPVPTLDYSRAIRGVYPGTLSFDGCQGRVPPTLHRSKTLFRDAIRWSRTHFLVSFSWTHYLCLWGESNHCCRRDREQHQRDRRASGR